jgi:hypothetical protein
MQKAALILLIMLWIVGAAVAGTPRSLTVYETADGGCLEETHGPRALSLHAAAAGANPFDGPLPPAPDSEVLWHYQIADGGPQRLNVAVGYNNQYVWSGGYYGGGKLFELDGDGDPLWEFERDGDFSAVAAATADVFYGAWGHEGAFEVYQFSAASSTPLWTWDGAAAGYAPADLANPGCTACAEDGSILAVGGNDGDSLAVMFFTEGSSTPLIFEDESLNYNPRQLRLTADGSKCILRAAATLYRIDTATATLEATYDLSSSTDCFGVSPDGSVVVYGFTGCNVIEWNGSAYEHVFHGYCPGSNYAGLGYVGADNEQVIVVWYATDYLQNWVTRFEKSSGSDPLWTYETERAGGSYQDVPTWIDASADGEWIAITYAGSETNTNDEVQLLRDSQPESLWWSLDTPGSATAVDITADGEYLATSGKNVHLNQMGSGGDVYAADIDQAVGIDDGVFTARDTEDGVLLEWRVEEAQQLVLVRDGEVLTNELDTTGVYLDRVPGGVYEFSLRVVSRNGDGYTYGPLEIRHRGDGVLTRFEEPYPNPAADDCSLRYSLAEAGAVRIALYDLSGRRVRLLVEGDYNAGRHEVGFSTVELPAGLYVLRLETAGVSYSRRLVIER